MRYLPEPEHRHGTIAKTAILLINLGTPDAPTPRAVRRYLEQFLSDRRVIEIPRALWLPILHGFVLNSRPKKSARKYARIWSSEGSPLKVHTERQARLLRSHFGLQVPMPLTVDFAMRYGEPSIAGTLARLKSEGLRARARASDVPPVRGEHDRKRAGSSRGVSAEDAQRAGNPAGEALSRSPFLYRRLRASCRSIGGSRGGRTSSS